MMTLAWKPEFPWAAMRRTEPSRIWVAAAAGIWGIDLNNIAAAAANEVDLARCILTFPRIVRNVSNAGRAGEDEQPDRSGFRTGASGSQLESNE